LAVAAGSKNELAIGFEGGDWHTHPDLLASWLAVPESEAVERFISLVIADNLPIIMSTDGGKTTDPWVSDNLPAVLSDYGASNCRLRYWSGASVSLGG